MPRAVRELSEGGRRRVATIEATGDDLCGTHKGLAQFFDWERERKCKRMRYELACERCVSARENVALAERTIGLNAKGKSKFVDFRGTRKGTILLCVRCEKATERNGNGGDPAIADTPKEK